jgi:phosphatidylglycerol:prolipoprotein diacylglycerol transferase
MHPILLKLGSFELHTYGALGAVAFLVIVSIALWRSRQLGLDPDRVVDVIFYTSLISIAGSRLLYVAQNPENFKTLWDVVNIRTGGLVFYGALVTGLPVAGGLMLRYNLPFYKLMDVFATTFPIAHAITRLGCFAAGCCYGVPTDRPWAVIFSDPRSVAPLQVALHPTQLYEVGTNLIIAAAVWWQYGRKKFDGQAMLLYLMLYAATRSVNEMFRGDAERGYFMKEVFGEVLSLSQGVSIVVAIAALAVFFWGARKWGRPAVAGLSDAGLRQGARESKSE